MNRCALAQWVLIYLCKGTHSIQGVLCKSGKVLESVWERMPDSESLGWVTMLYKRENKTSGKITDVVNVLPCGMWTVVQINLMQQKKNRSKKKL